MHPSRLCALLIPAFALCGCTGSDHDRRVFELLSPEQTGISFANTITTSDSVNVQSDVYIYNGAGVAIGDVDNDGLPDIFFAGNMVSSRLYLNKGQMKFEDVTERAGVKTTRWATGVTMVDINNDGYLDIYVSVSGPKWSKTEERGNLLFVNNRDRTFTECAAKYGIGDDGFTTQSAFLDYDGDGDLDLFLLENSPEDFARGDLAAQPGVLRAKTPGSYNQLYRNNGDGTFTNASKEAGILEDAGYGLGVVVADLNEDGRPDIYVSNDVTPNDVVYVNNGNGTFTNKAPRSLKHGSYAGMGVDAADYNNDGWADVLQVDMMPRDLSRRKRTSGFSTYSGFLQARSRGFRDDYSVNSLQLSNGVTPQGDVVFSEVSRMAGVSHTDWSWSALFADFDDDGFKDIFISNGYPKAVNDLDYMTVAAPARQRGNDARARELLKALPGYEMPNYVFRNNGDLTFADETKAWGMEQPSYSYGAAYADLDNDGKLDLVVTNIDAPAFVYHNVRPSTETSHYLAVELKGDAPNVRGIGSKLVLTAGGQKQHLYYSPYRGYMSSMDDRAHFGLGAPARAESLEVIWPNGRRQILTDVAADRLVVLKQSDAQPSPKPPSPPAANPRRAFEPIDSYRAIAYKHQTPSFVDYAVQPLLPYMLTRHGAPLAVGDVDGDGIDDVFIGGGAGVPGKLFMQHKDGTFTESVQGQPWEADKGFDDWGALFFDANGDGLLDLYVASGGYQLAPTSALLQDRLYLNKGGGRFERDARALPLMIASTAVVRAADFTGDGKLDLFVGGRLTPRSYPSPARSYLLRNDGDHFTDVTQELAPELIQPGGMITDAAFTDFDGDGRVDLVTVGEWMPIQFHRNDGGRRFVDVTGSTRLPPSQGWWSSLAVGDFDRDGRPDIVAGNFGLNHTYTTTKDGKFGVYAMDLLGNRAADVILTQEIDGKEYTVAGMVPLGRELYPLSLRFPTYGAFADASLHQLFAESELRQAVHYQTDTFASLYLHNDGRSTFSASPLPMAAQIAPIKGIVVDDVDGDGNLDLVVAGNLYDTEPNTPRADAGNGLWLRGDGRGHFDPISPRSSGFLAPLDVSALALVRTPNGRAIIVINTNDSLATFAIKK